MTKCIRCGSELPATGACARCATSAPPPPGGVPPIPPQNLDLDRRTRPPPPPPGEFMRPPGPAAARPAPAALPVGQRPTVSLPAAPRTSPPAAARPVAPPRSAPPPPLPAPVASSSAPTQRLPVLSADSRDTDRFPVPAPPARAAPAPALGGEASEAPTQVAPRPSAVRSAEAKPEEIHYRRAALWRRLLAGTVDALILAILSAGYLFIAARAAGIQAGPAPSGGLDLAAHLLHAWAPVLLPGAVVALALGVVYAAVFAMLLGGRSPGRALAGVRLVDSSGAPPGPIRAVLRALMSVVSLAFLFAGFWLALFDRRGQTLHDKLSGTFIVQPLQTTRRPGTP